MIYWFDVTMKVRLVVKLPALVQTSTCVTSCVTQKLNLSRWKSNGVFMDLRCANEWGRLSFMLKILIDRDWPAPKAMTYAPPQVTMLRKITLCLVVCISDNRNNFSQTLKPEQRKPLIQDTTGKHGWCHRGCYKIVTTIGSHYAVFKPAVNSWHDHLGKSMSLSWRSGDINIGKLL